ncbi:MAG: sigma-70 family RNA polymerase sigma factor [Planctomycetota bacterium]
MDDAQTRVAIESAIGGDEQAIHALLTQHLAGLRAFLRLRMGPELRAKESASDLVQSVCLDLLRNMGRYQYRSDANFRRWLYLTAMRKVSNKVAYYRRERRDVAREADVESVGAAYGTLSTPSRGAMQREEVERLERVFDSLAPDHREVLTLSRLVGLSHREIAEIMGRSETATRSLLVRALAALSKALEQPATAE